MHDVKCFKNVLLTLSSKHQQMMAYFLDSPNLFKPKLSVDKIKTSLDEKLRMIIERHYLRQASVSLAKNVYLYGTQYVKGMVSAGQCSGLPEFYKIMNILVDYEIFHHYQAIILVHGTLQVLPTY